MKLDLPESQARFTANRTRPRALLGGFCSRFRADTSGC